MGSEVQDVTLANEVLWPTVGSKGSGRTLLSEERPLRVKLTLSQGELLLEGPRPEPRWLYPSLDALQRLSRLAPNWDTYGGRRILDRAVIGTLQALINVFGHLDPELDPPTIVPTSNGGLQLEWHAGNRDIEVRISPEGRTSALLSDDATGEEIVIDALQPTDFRRVADAVAAIR